MPFLRKTTDFLVIGGGIIGITIALELKRRYADSDVTLIDKERILTEHASGRNSGVLHAGFYYTAESLKARFTRQGNQELTQYCFDRNLPLNQCGKLVVTRSEDELQGLHTLYDRGQMNDVSLKLISAAEAKEIEPRVKTCGQALFSPATSTLDPVQTMRALEKDALHAGIDIQKNTQYLQLKPSGILTSRGIVDCGYVVNAAGLYADAIAQDFGYAKDFRILPFKGLYLYSTEFPSNLSVHVYPVPDLRKPFLGVHCTLTADQRVKIGPTAIPAFWRENYQGIDRFHFFELLQTTWLQLGLFAKNAFGFRTLAFEEIQKYGKDRLVSMASDLIEGINSEHFSCWGRPGLRAQLVNTKTHRLVMDFLFEGNAKSFHVLNAVSPGLTCAMPFSRYVVDSINDCLT
jgi:L-2-hydroxyglutarate oxidase LhgO